MYTKRKVERKFNTLPPTWCQPICSNAMNEACLMQCVSRRDASWFDLKEGVEFSNLPRFSLQEWSRMSGKERQMMVGIRMKLLEDHIRGPIRPVIPLRVTGHKNGRTQLAHEMIINQSGFDEEE